MSGRNYVDIFVVWELVLCSFGRAILSVNTIDGIWGPDGEGLGRGDGKEALTLKGHERGVQGVAFSPDGKRLASTGGGLEKKEKRVYGEVKVWDAQTGKEVLSLRGHATGVEGVAFSPDSQPWPAPPWTKR